MFVNLGGALLGVTVGKSKMGTCAIFEFERDSPLKSFVNVSVIAKQDRELALENIISG